MKKLIFLLFLMFFVKTSFATVFTDAMLKAQLHIPTAITHLECAADPICAYIPSYSPYTSNAAWIYPTGYCTQASPNAAAVDNVHVYFYPTTTISTVVINGYTLRKTVGNAYVQIRKGINIYDDVTGALTHLPINTYYGTTTSNWRYSNGYVYANVDTGLANGAKFSYEGYFGNYLVTTPVYGGGTLSVKVGAKKYDMQCYAQNVDGTYN
jgi:hypothetical protein